jgi:ubiquinol-cytochrome c reductase cytochrome b subunit
LFIFNFLLLGWLGAQSAEEPYVTISQVASIFYFLYFLVILPVLSFIDLKSSAY